MKKLLIGGTVAVASLLGFAAPAFAHDGPGSRKPQHACDGKGIDYIDACFGG